MTISEKINLCIDKIHKLMKEDAMFNNRTMHHILKSYSDLYNEIEKTGKISGKSYLKMNDLSEYISLIFDRYCDKFAKMINKAKRIEKEKGFVPKAKKFNFEALTNKEIEGEEAFINKTEKLWTLLGEVKMAAQDCMKAEKTITESEK